MNEIRMVVGDLDDTILNSQKQISPAMRRMRRLLRGRGIIFAVATARSVGT